MDQISIAYHEAGHTVLAVLGKIPVEFVTIEPDGETDTLGRSRIEFAKWLDGSVDRLGALNVGMVLMGGTVANMVQGDGDPNSETEAHYGVDARALGDWHEAVVRAGGDLPDYQEWTLEVLLLAEDALMEHWHLVENLVNALMETPTIRGPAIAEAMYHGTRGESTGGN